MIPYLVIIDQCSAMSYDSVIIYEFDEQDTRHFKHILSKYA